MSWIKIRHDLDVQPEVLALARAMRWPVARVVGVLVKFWSWLDLASRSAGRVAGATSDDLVAATGTPRKFWVELQAVGWLRIGPKGIVAPGFDRWAATTAKSRTANAERQARFRAKEKERQAELSAGDKGQPTEKNNALRNRYVTPQIRSETDESDLTDQNQTRSSAMREKPLATDPADQKTKAPLTADGRTKPRGTALELHTADLAGGRVERLAADLFREAGYSGDDGEVFWKAAALVACGRIAPSFRLAESVARSAARGTGLGQSKTNRAGYFRTTLVTDKQAGMDVAAALASIRLPAEFKSPPKPRANVSDEFLAGIGRGGDGPP